MIEDTRERLIRGDIWSRALYMILFAFIYSISKFIVIIVVVFQFFTILFTGSANEPLLKFGNSLAIYIREMLDFQTFNTEQHPFPFSPWPDEDYGGERWLELDDDETTDPQDDDSNFGDSAEAEDSDFSAEDSEEEDPEKGLENR